MMAYAAFATAPRSRPPSARAAGARGPSGTLYIGDNLAALAGIAPASVDLVYLDPPFNSGRDYATSKRIGKTPANTVAFGDRFRWDAEAAAGFDTLVRDAMPTLRYAMQALEVAYPRSPLLAYCVFIAPRLAALHRALKLTGALWLHCDDSANFALALLLDGIFGPSPLSQRIVWKRTVGGHNAPSKRWGRVHDTLLFYLRKPWTSRHRRNTPPRPPPIPSFWDDIPPLGSSSTERIGYPTQKPLALLRRIIALSSKPGDTVLDPFVGSGTTVVAAQAMGRRWIGMDLSPLAADVVRARLAGVAFRVVERSAI